MLEIVAAEYKIITSNATFHNINIKLFGLKVYDYIKNKIVYFVFIPKKNQ